MSHSFKIIGAIAILTAIIIGISAYSINLLKTTSDNLVSYIEKIDNSAKAGDWDEAQEQFFKFTEYWLKVHEKWAILLDHAEIDNIDDSMAKLKKYIEVKDTSASVGEAAALMQYIKHIPEKEALSLVNIF